MRVWPSRDFRTVGGLSGRSSPQPTTGRVGKEQEEAFRYRRKHWEDRDCGDLVSFGRHSDPEWRFCFQDHVYCDGYRPRSRAKLPSSTIPAHFGALFPEPKGDHGHRP